MLLAIFISNRRYVFYKIVFLKVWKMSQEIPVPKQVPVPKYLFFNKVASGLQFCQKRDPGTDVFQWILRNF